MLEVDYARGQSKERTRISNSSYSATAASGGVHHTTGMRGGAGGDYFQRAFSTHQGQRSGSVSRNDHANERVSIHSSANRRYSAKKNMWAHQ